MMAVTSSGIRIYFADSLHIAHVRLPPRLLANLGAFDASTLSQQSNQPPQQPFPSQPFGLGEVRYRHCCFKSKQVRRARR